MKDESNMIKEELIIVFMGTPEFAVESLKRLVDGGYNVVAVVTQPDKPVGRHGSVLKASAVKEYALSRAIPVLQPEKMKDPEFVSELASYKADLQVVVAFRMLPEVVWDMPRFGTFNVHAALLPQYRGAAPINWAVINGETMTGVTTFFLDHDIDTGRIIMQREFPIPDDADVEFVYDGLMNLGAELCIDTVDKIIETEGNVEALPQPEDVELKPAPKLFNETCKIDWSQPAKRIYDFIRGLSPYPGAWSDIHTDDTPQSLPDGKGATLKVYRAKKTSRPTSAEPGSVLIERNQLFVATADEWLELLFIQPAGKKRMLSSDYINGLKNNASPQPSPKGKGVKAPFHLG